MKKYPKFQTLKKKKRKKKKKKKLSKYRLT